MLLQRITSVRLWIIIIMLLVLLPTLSTCLQINLGFLNLISGQPEQAEVRFSRLVKKNPDMDHAWYGLGQAMARQGKLSDAIEAYSTSLRIDPDYPMARLKRAELYQSLGEEQQAKTDYRILGSAELLIRVGRIARDMGDLKLAQIYFRTAIQIAPDNWVGYYLSALVSYEQGNFQESQELLQQALKTKPRDSSSVLMLKGRTEYVLTQYAACVETFTQYIDRQSQVFTGWYMRGICQQALGKFDRAISDFEQAIRIIPTDPNSHIHLARLFLTIGDPESALHEYQFVLDLLPDDLEAKQAVERLNLIP